jgi:hypothetical protein
MAAKIQLGNSVLCDYVAKGEGNKAILVNTYSGDVIAQTLPAMLGFGVFVETFTPALAKLTGEVTVSLDGQKLLSFQTEIAPNNGTEPAIIAITQFQALVQKDCDLEVSLRIPGFRVATVLKKRIRQQAVAMNPSPILPGLPGGRSLSVPPKKATSP